MSARHFSCTVANMDRATHIRRTLERRGYVVSTHQTDDGPVFINAHYPTEAATPAEIADAVGRALLIVLTIASVIFAFDIATTLIAKAG